MEQNRININFFIKNLDLIIAGLALVVLVCTTFGGVIMRYFFAQPFSWGEEVQLWCFVWITFFGAGAAFRTGSHVAIEILVERLPDSAAKAVEFVGYLIVMAVLAFFTWQSEAIISQMASMGRSTNILHIPYTLIYSAIPIGCILMMINYTAVIFQRVKDRPAAREEK